MQRPRVSIRGMMGLVLLVAVALHPSLVADRVGSTREDHTHQWVEAKGNRAFNATSVAEVPPLWPRYWRCLFGMRWKSLPLCPPVEGRLMELCEIADPRIHQPGGAVRFSPEPIALQKPLDEQPERESHAHVVTSDTAQPHG